MGATDQLCVHRRQGVGVQDGPRPSGRLQTPLVSSYFMANPRGSTGVFWGEPLPPVLWLLRCHTSNCSEQQGRSVEHKRGHLHPGTTFKCIWNACFENGIWLDNLGLIQSRKQ